jgi:hypothetical protein
VVGAQEAGVKEARVGAAKEAESTLPKVREGAAEEGTAAGVKAGVMEEASKVVTREAVIQGVTAVMEVAASSHRVEPVGAVEIKEGMKVATTAGAVAAGTAAAAVVGRKVRSQEHQRHGMVERAARRPRAQRRSAHCC